MRSEVPSGWKWTRIGQHFQRVRRKNTAGVTRVLTASGKHGLIDQEEFFNKRIAAAKLAGYFHLKRGEFAYNRSSMNGYPCGAIKRLDRYDDGVLSTLYLCFGILQSSGILSDYAAQLFDSGQLDDELRPIARVGARAHGLLNVTPDDFMEVSFPLPPLPEQTKIAAILSSVDEAIQATQAVSEQTRRVKEGLLQTLLTRGIGHTRFKQTEIGEIPEGWEVRRLEDLAAFVTSGSRGWAQYYAHEGALFVRITNLTRDSIDIDLSDPKYVALPPETSEGKRTRLIDGDILISITADLGIIGLVGPDLGEAYVNQHIALVRLSGGSVSPAFIAYYLASCRGRQQFGLLDDAGAKAGLNLPNVRSVRVPIPSEREQGMIVSRLRASDEMGVSNESALEQLRQVKAGLLQDLLTGKVRVSV